MSEDNNIAAPKKYEFAANFASQPAVGANDYSDSFEPYTPDLNAHEHDDNTSHIDIDRLIQDSYDQGFYEGRIYAGDTEGSHLAKIGKLFESKILLLESDFRDLQRNLGQTLAGILTEVLAKIVEGVPEDLIAKTIASHLHKIHTHIPLTPLLLKANPQIASRLKTHVEQLVQGGLVTIQEDAQMPLSQCHIDWENGGWSLRLDQFVDQTLDFLMKPETTSVILAQPLETKTTGDEV